MKKKALWINLLAITVILIFTISCEKDDNAAKTNTVINSDGKTGTLTDIEGNKYKIVKIGNQWWMAENLRTKMYNDNTPIPLVTDNSSWISLTTPAYCWYNNDKAANENTYGALYNWFTVNASSNGGKNVCPTGWHVPSDNEWTTLIMHLGGESVAGGKLKEIGISHWNNPNTGATNETGFSALPGGLRSNNGTYGYINGFGLWWSSTEIDTYNARNRNLFSDNSAVYPFDYDKKIGMSVRCIKD